MSKRLVLVMAALVALGGFMPLTALSHGVEGSITPGGLVGAARYDGGEPMSHAKVTITSPTSDKTFQTGRADRHGRFAFHPDAQGIWEVVVNDEMGHRLRLSVKVEADTLQTGYPAPKGNAMDFTTRIGKVFLGISLICLAYAVLLWHRARRIVHQTPKS